MEVSSSRGLRVSDEPTVEIVKMVLVGKQNKDIVLQLNREGQPAVGLCGDDGSLFRVRKQLAGGEIDIGFVGEIERVDVDVINHIAAGLHPGDRVGRRGRGGQLVQHQRRRRRRRSGDRAPAPTRSIFLTDVPGWLRDPSDPGSKIGAGHGRTTSTPRCPR